MEFMNIALVGIGKIGQRHLNIWSQLDDVEVVGIVVRNEGKAKEIEEAFAIKTYRNITELLQQQAVDAFDICTPPDTHLTLVQQAAEAGKHIIISKPLAITGQEAEEIVRICERYQVQLLVGHTLRFFPEYANAQQQIQNGAIGRPGVIRMSRGVPYPSRDSDWYTNDQRSGGLFVDLGVHEFEWILSTFGEVERVMARHIKKVENTKTPIEYGLVMMRLVDGTVVHIELSWAETKYRASFELAGNKGMISYDHDEANPVNFDIHHEEDRIDLPKSMLREDPYVRQLKHFQDCLKGKMDAIISPAHAVAAIQIAEAARKSAVEGQPVYVGKEDA